MPLTAAPAVEFSGTPLAASRDVGSLVAQFERRAMGSPLRLTLVGQRPAVAEHAWRIVVDEFEASEQAMSRFRGSSGATLVNRAAGTGLALTVDRRLMRALVAADRAGRLTEGRFDARVLAVLERLGYVGADPDGADLGSAGIESPGSATAPGPVAESGTERWLVAAPRAGTVAVHCPVDLGGIGKGLALRWAWRAVERSGILDTRTPTAANPIGFLLEAGGDLVARGWSGAGAPWSIGIEDPTGGMDPLAVIAVSDGAVVTSSITVNRWQTATGRIVHHLIDPQTGEPGGEGLLAVSVAGPDPAWAEVWSKTLFLAGAGGITGLARSRGLAAWWAYEDGQLEMTAAARAQTVWVAGER